MSDNTRDGEKLPAPLSDPIDRRTQWALLLGSTLLALCASHTQADSFNDRSRLALVESLVEEHTFQIDDHRYETGDQVYVKGHYYTDKPPVQSILMAGVYRLGRTLFGLSAEQHPRLYYYLLNVTSSGLAYVVAVVFFYRLVRLLRLEWAWSLALTLSFALGTVALPYMQVINSHIIVLALGTVMLERVVYGLASGEPPSALTCGLLGLLGGLGYALEQVGGGLLMGGIACLLVIHYRSVWMLVFFALGVLPFAGLHHAVVYSIAGTFRPINANPAHFDYPGSHFGPNNMTGRWTHPSLAYFAEYAISMLIGNRGFLQYNLPLFLAIPGAGLWLYRHGGLLPARRYDSTAEGSDAKTWQGEHLVVLFCCGWILLGYGVYALFSTGYAGKCLAIRWFVPQLVAAYLLLALVIRDMPWYRFDFVLLATGGLALGASMITVGGWDGFTPFFWWIHGGTLALVLALSPSWPRFVMRGWLLDPPVMSATLGLGALALVSLAPLFLDPRPMNVAPKLETDFQEIGRAVCLLSMGAILGLRARADERRCVGGATKTLLLALLSLGLMLVYWVIRFGMESTPPWQTDSYLATLNSTSSWHFALPVGFVRVVERSVGDLDRAYLLSFWFFGFWFLWAFERVLGRLTEDGPDPGAMAGFARALAVLLLLFADRVGDPMSLALLMLGVLLALERLSVEFGLALGLGLWSSPLAGVLIPVYVWVNRSGGKRTMVEAGVFCVLGVAAVLTSTMVTS